VQVGKLNVDNNPQVAASYGVRSIPTILILKDGEIVDKQVGLTSKVKLAEKIEAVLATATPAPAVVEAAVPAGPFKFTDSNFDASALKNDKVSVIDFWAEWCGPCKAITPIIEELATTYSGKATIIILKNGEVVDKHVGMTSKATLAEKIDAALA